MRRHPRFEIQTARLTIRMLSRADLTEFVRYRNLPDVARYQDWQLPFTGDLAADLIDEMDELSGPTPGGWVQLALDAGSGLIGDIAVWLDDTCSLAMIGYTLAPEHQGKGYAIEAVAGMTDWLFTQRGVHRIAATLDPRNLSSARVLERNGFDYVGTATSAAIARGEWTDDARYTLLIDGWRAWTSRATGRPEHVELVEVSSDNLRAVCALDVAPSQRRFVSSVAQSIADAAHPDTVGGAPVSPWYRAIVADGQLVGFVMIARRTEHHPVTYLWRFMVDRRHQRRGIASRAIRLLAEMLSAEGDHELELSFNDGPGSPESFYRRLGFERTGAIEPESGEIVARAVLATIIERTHEH